MAWTQELAAARPWEEFAACAIKTALRPVQILISVPSLLFLAALAAMLLRHPDVRFFEIDRVAFGLLLLAVVLRGLVRGEALFHFERASLPMVGLILLAVVSVAGQPFDHETWSLLASKFLVPFVLFHLAGVVFEQEVDRRKFEIFAITVLAYLCFTAIAFFAGLHSLIFPKFILDESLGFHADRARGPLLQAVANGVSLNILGLVAVHAYERAKSKRLLILLVSLPLAILATMTRTVWLAFAGCVFAVFLRGGGRQRRLVWILLAACAGLAVVLSSNALTQDLRDRLEERGPIDYRQAVYNGGWEMFLERPWLGWGFHQMPSELPRHVSGYRLKVLYPHNTYLELLVEHGVLGLGLYLWLMWELWRLRGGPVPPGEERGFLNQNFHRLWPVMLCVYWVNAAVVVMSYQFVNGLLFAMAGMLGGQQRRAGQSAC